MKKTNLYNLEITDDHDLRGGGEIYAKYYVDFLKKFKVPYQNKMFEWCAGPGYIGFSLLSNYFCDELYLADINPKAIHACKKTIDENKLSSVMTYLSDNLNSVPIIKFDFIVGNPPHFNIRNTAKRYDLRSHDENWNVHTSFFNQVKDYMHEKTVILLIESMTKDPNSFGSSPKILESLLKNSDLKILFSLPQKNYYYDNHFKTNIKQYFIGLSLSEYVEDDWVKQVQQYSNKEAKQ